MRKTIAQLEDELKQAERRNDELRAERDERDALISEMREQIEDCDAMIESWKEAFEMVQDEDGVWQWDSSFVEGEQWIVKYIDLRKQWNAAVAAFNAKIAPRPVGHPLAASESQVADVLHMRKDGMSLRNIAEETSLSLGTVRTIVGNETKTTRAWRKRFERVAPDKFAESAWKSRSRMRAALPRRINENQKTGRDLIKRAKGLK